MKRKSKAEIEREQRLATFHKLQAIAVEAIRDARRKVDAFFKYGRELDYIGDETSVRDALEVMAASPDADTALNTLERKSAAKQN